MKKLIILGILGFMLFGCLTADASSVQTDANGKTIGIYPLRSLDTSKDLVGSFVIGIGNVGTEMEYYVYVEQPDGSLRFQSIQANMVDVFEDDTQPRLVQEGCCTLKMHIPRDTIKREYKIDMSN